MYIYQIMSNNFGYLDIILLAMIAGFIILRLRNILGRKTGHQDKVYSSFSEKEFLEGAKSAFKIIIEAFVDSDIEKLKPLLDYELLKSFTKSIS